MKMRQFCSPLLFVLMLALGVASQLVTVAEANLSLELTKSVAGGLTEVQSGQTFTYNFAYRCVSITNDCEDAVITDPLPPELEFVDLARSPQVETAVYDPNTHTVTYTFVNPLPAGSTGLLSIEARFAPGTLPDTVATNTATFSVSNGTPVTTPPVDITATGEFEMFAQKRVLGDTVVGFPVVYELAICSPDTIGGVNFTGVEFVDDLPADAIFLDAQGTETTDWVYDAGNNRITFVNLPDVLVGGCFTRTVTVRYDAIPNPDPENFVTITGFPEACDGSVTPTPDHCNGSTDPVTLGPVGASATIIPPFPEFTVDKSSTSASSYSGTEVLPGEALTYTISARNSGYITLTNVIMEDFIPAEVEVTSFDVGASDSTVGVFYQTDQNGAWQPLAGNPYTSTTTIDVSTLGLAGGDFITALRWEVGTLLIGSGWNANISGVVDPTIVPVNHPAPPPSFTNCVDGTADAEGAPQADNACSTAEVVDQRSIPVVSKITDGNSFIPGDEVTFDIYLRNADVAHLDFVDPIVADLLPPELDLLPGTVTYVSGPAGAPTPTLSIVDDYNGTGRTLVRWAWEGGTSYRMAPTDQFHMQLTAEVIDFTPPGRYFNEAAVLTNNTVDNPNIRYCNGEGGEYTDVNDLDGDADTTEVTCKNPPSEGFFDVAVFLSMESEKFVWGELDSGWNKLGRTVPGGQVDWQMVITNTSNVTTTSLIVYDVLPFIGDTGVIDTQARQSEWRPNLQGPVEGPVGIPLTVSYSTSENPCRPEVTNAAGCDNDWTTTFPADNPTSVQALRFEFCDGGGCLELPIGGSLALEWPMVAPNEAPANAACDNPYDPNNHQQFAVDFPACEIAWNSFGFVASGSGATLLPTEPIRVGIRVLEEPRFALGDLVWLDVAGFDQDHVQQVAEQELWGVDGVRVELWNPGVDNTANTADDQIIDTDGDGEVDFRITGPNHFGYPGYYLFPNLPAGNYFVKFFPPSDYTTSTANQGGDDTIDSDGELPGTDPTYGNYLSSVVINLNTADDLTWDQGLWLAADYGDLPYDGVTYNYPVVSTGSPTPELAARHIIVADMYLGASVDAELDGAQSIDADGDDLTDVPDDEDGIVFKTPLISGQEACIDVSAQTAAAQAANLSAWFDFDGDGTLDNTTEKMLNDVRPDSGTDLGGGIYEHCFTVPVTTNHGGVLYSRFRLSTDDGLTPEGTANDGEVEDYRLDLACVGNYVFDDNDEDDVQSAGDVGLPDIPVTLTWGGPDGVIGSGGDDETYTVDTDANGEYHFCGLLADPTDDGDDEYQISVYPVGFPTTPNQGGDDTLDSDGDANGVGPIFTIPFPLTTLDTAINDNSYEGYPDDRDDLRFDFGFVVYYDWGDLPDTAPGRGNGNYWTEIGDNGPRHIINGNNYLGDCVDGEDDGQGDATASGDDGTASVIHTSGTCTGTDDEDGVRFITPLVPGGIACVEVTTTGGGRLSGWVDWNGDGDFQDGNERIINNRTVNDGVNRPGAIANGQDLCFRLPNNPTAVTNGLAIYSRFRLTANNNENGNQRNGVALSGEIEDYYQQLMCLGDQVWLDEDDSGTINGAEVGLNGVGLQLFVDFDEDGVLEPGGDDFDSWLTGTTASNGGMDGAYSFCGLVPASYYVRVQANNFAAGQPFELFGSSTANNDPEAVTAEDDDNGDDGGDAAANGIVSVAVLDLTVDGEPTTSDANTNDGTYTDGNTNMTLDFGLVAPPMDLGDLPASFGITTIGDNGARHTDDGLTLGTVWDADNNGQESATTSGDDGDGTDDEDGVIAMGNWGDGNGEIMVNTSGNGCLNVWLDFTDGSALTADSDFDDTYNTGGSFSEHVLENEIVTTGNNSLSFNLPNGIAASGVLNMRARLTPRDGDNGCAAAEAYSSTVAPTGLATGGEVEDYQFAFPLVTDWGDLPDGDGTGRTYPTNTADNGEGSGASHVINGVNYLGACVDSEANGQPNDQAVGDNGAIGAPVSGTCTGNDDEDGITLATNIVAGQTACVDVTTVGGGILNGWVDFNGNGTLEAGEQVISNVTVADGLNQAGSINSTEDLCYDVPVDASGIITDSLLYSRFRLTANTTEGGDSPVGPASTGEVEDYAVPFLCLGDLVWYDADDSGTVNGGEYGLNGVLVNLYLDDGDGLFNGADTLIDSMTTAQLNGVDGSYLFCGLNEGGYFVEIPSTEFEQGDPLYLLGSSTANNDPDADPAVENDDDGTDSGDAATFGINVTNMVTLTLTNEPTANDANTQDPLTGDANTNMAVDFGLFPTVQMDYGDLPDSYEETEFGDDGARHVDDGLILGSVWDAETDGQESANTTGDDDDGNDDEDGVAMTGNWSDGQGEMDVTVTGGNGCLNVWIDFTDGAATTADGDFADTYNTGGTFPEHVVQNLAVTAGLTPVTFNLPISVADNATLNVRVRLSPEDGGGGCANAEGYSSGTAMPTGLATGGEVEDYQINFTPTAVTLSQMSATGSNQVIFTALVLVLMLLTLTAVVVYKRRP